MKLIARLFALSLVVTGAVASTQMRNLTSDVRLGQSLMMGPPAVCPPGGTTCGMDQKN